MAPGPGHFARTYPVPGHPRRANVVAAAQPAAAGPAFGVFACASPLARSGRTELVAFARAAAAVAHSPQPAPDCSARLVPVEPARAVPAARARDSAAHPARPPKPGIAQTGFPVTARSFPTGPCPPARIRQLRCWPMLPLWSAPPPRQWLRGEPAPRPPIELPALTEAADCQPAKPTPLPGALPDFRSPQPRYRPLQWP